MFATKFITRTVQSSVARRGFAEAAPAVAAGAQMILNFTTPHQPIYKKHPVSMVIIPSESGEYGVSAGHSPIISQLKPGVVTVIHQGGATEKYFIPGGFALTSADSVTDLSVTEAIPLADLDEAAIKAAYAESSRVVAASADNSVAKAAAMIEVDLYASMARAVGISV